MKPEKNSCYMFFVDIFGLGRAQTIIYFEVYGSY